jgi:hypothetical protein
MIRFDNTPLIDGAIVLGTPLIGVLAEDIPSEGENGGGYAYPSLEFPEDSGKYIRGFITRFPTNGTLLAYEDTSFEYDGLSDTFDFQLYIDGVPTGSPQLVTLSIGGASNVSSDSTTQYNIREAIFSESVTDYNVNQFIASDSVFNYNIRSNVAQSLTSSYTVKGVVLSDLNIDYNILSSTVVGNSLLVSYSVSGLVQNDFTTNYNVRENQTSDLTVTYEIVSSLSSINNDIITSYNVRGIVGNNLPIYYFVQGETNIRRVTYTAYRKENIYIAMVKSQVVL